jgi:hypothetical protein
LAEIACGNFSGHWARTRSKSVVFARCAGEGRLRRFGGNFSGHWARTPTD